MIETATRRPGRPPKLDKALVRREILVHPDVDAEAFRIADEQGLSVAEVYRAWIDAGRKRKAR